MFRYYCIYDHSLKRANFPFAAHDDGEAKQTVRNMLLSFEGDTAAILPKIREHCDVRYCGSFDPESGVFKLDELVGATVFDLSEDTFPGINFKKESD